MRQDSVAQRGIGQSCDHRNLDGGHHLRRADTERRETEDAVAVRFDQRLQKAARFRQRARTQDCFHGNLEQAVRHASRLGVVLTESHAGQFRVREQAIRHVPARRHTVNADEVVMHDTEIVHADVGKLRAACHLADRPHAGRGRLQALVDLDVSTWSCTPTLRIIPVLPKPGKMPSSQHMWEGATPWYHTILSISSSCLHSSGSSFYCTSTDPSAQCWLPPRQLRSPSPSSPNATAPTCLNLSRG